jgi:AraC family transcriptional regulator of adaptative response/methylated-DNA-[protein]-cysteine methyltransferase
MISENPAMNAYTNHAACWEAVRTRDASADGRFFCCVLSTGIYCYPSCASRPTRPENVVFHPDPASAERAGFRACKRCRPDLPPRAEREAALVARACRSIERAEDALSLEELAEEAGVSAFHFHRLFRRITGVTPKAYAAAKRADRVQTVLARAPSVTDSLYAAGFSSSGRFYEAAPGILGMTPTAWRKGAEGETISYATGPCSLGMVLVAATERGICAILLGDNEAGLQADLASRFPRAAISHSVDFTDYLAQVIAKIEAPGTSLALPLDIRGTAFQRQVWQALQQIPAGETRSYSELAAELGQPGAARAVAGACAANKLAVAVPCHRVVGRDGALTGYRWGVARKRALLAREASA